jgi:hypothetical protein
MFYLTQATSSFIMVMSIYLGKVKEMLAQVTT